MQPLPKHVDAQIPGTWVHRAVLTLCVVIENAVLTNQNTTQTLGHPVEPDADCLVNARSCPTVRSCSPGECARRGRKCASARPSCMTPRLRNRACAF